MYGIINITWYLEIGFFQIPLGFYVVNAQAFHLNFVSFGDSKGRRSPINTSCKCVCTHISPLAPTFHSLGLCAHRTAVKKHILESLLQRWSKWERLFYLVSQAVQSGRSDSLRVMAHCNILSRYWCIFSRVGGKQADLIHLESDASPGRCFAALSIWASKCPWHPYCFHF